MTRAVEDETKLDGAVAEFSPDPVDGGLGGGALPGGRIDEVARIGEARFAEVRNADADQPIARAVRLAGK